MVALNSKASFPLLFRCVTRLLGTSTRFFNTAVLQERDYKPIRSSPILPYEVKCENAFPSKEWRRCSLSRSTFTSGGGVLVGTVHPFGAAHFTYQSQENQVKDTRYFCSFKTLAWLKSKRHSLSFSHPFFNCG